MSIHLGSVEGGMRKDGGGWVSSRLSEEPEGVNYLR